VRSALVATVATVAAAMVLVGCTSEAPEDTTETRASAPATTATPTSPSTTPAPTQSAPPDPNSLPALFDEDVIGGELDRVRNLGGTDAYTRHEVTYRSGDLRISGQLLVPRGDGPHPAVVLNHGYIDPAVYANGQGMPREQDYLAREGFVVLHVDYRGHAASDDTDELDLELRLGYARDSIAAVKTLRTLDDVDPERIGMLGRSMGGGVTMNALVADPDIVKAAVIHSSVSSRFVDNFRRWTEPGRPDEASALERRFGTIEESPDFWRNLSPRTYFDRLDASLLMVHGALDESCPVGWARGTASALEAAGADAELVVYDDEGHTFAGRWADKMERTVDFLREKLDA
jgi:dipeptidyl aminopeptidase/acylaminoacyl peptidase